jgi:hypothetical protein
MNAVSFPDSTAFPQLNKAMSFLGIFIVCKDYSSLVGSPAHGRNGAGRSCHDKDAKADYFLEAISQGHL